MKTQAKSAYNARQNSLSMLWEVVIRISNRRVVQVTHNTRQRDGDLDIVVGFSTQAAGCPAEPLEIVVESVTPNILERLSDETIGEIEKILRNPEVSGHKGITKVHF